MKMVHVLPPKSQVIILYSSSFASVLSESFFFIRDNEAVGRTLLNFGYVVDRFFH
jgi:hypothetical protein